MDILLTCIRLLVLDIGFLCFELPFMDYIMIRRRSILPVILFMSILLPFKHIVFYYLFPLYFPEEASNPLLSSCFFLFSLITAIAVFRYTYQATVLKIAILNLLIEINCSLNMVVVLTLVNQLGGRENTIYIAPFLPVDLLYIPIMTGLMLLETRLLKPIRNFICTFDLPNRFPLWLMILLAAAITLPNAIDGFSDISIAHIWGVFPAVVISAMLLLLLFWFAIAYNRQTVQTRQYIDAQKRLMHLHYRSVRRQILRMNQDQSEINAQMKQILTLIRQDQNGHLVRKEQLRTYIDTLQKKLEDIQCFFYCNDHLVDAVLYYGETACRQKGIDISLSFAQYNRKDISEQTIAEILYQIFNFFIGDADKCKTPASVLFIQSASVRNYFLLELSITSEKPKRTLRKKLYSLTSALIRPYHGEWKEMDSKLILFLQHPHTDNDCTEHKGEQDENRNL